MSQTVHRRRAPRHREPAVRMQGRPAAQFRPPLTATNIPIPVDRRPRQPGQAGSTPPVPGRRRSGIVTRRALTAFFSAAATH